MPRGGPGRHGGSINKDDPLTSYANRAGQSVQIRSADDCADACFARPGCIGMNFYVSYTLLSEIKNWNAEFSALRLRCLSYVYWKESSAEVF